MKKFKRLISLLADIYHLVPQLIIASLFKTLLSIVNTLMIIYFPILVIIQLQTNQSSNQMIKTLLTFVFIHLALRLMINFLDYKISINRDYGNDLMIQQINESLIDAPYPLLEDTTFIDLKEGALSAFDQYYLVSMIFEVLNVFIENLLTISSLILVVALNAPPLLIMIIMISLIAVFLHQLIKKKELRIRELQISLRKSLNYFHNLTNHLEYAKDIQIYNLNDFITNRLEIDLDQYTNILSKQTKQFDLRSVLTNGLDITLRIFLYLWLIALAINQQLHIDQALLILTSTIALNKANLSILNQWSKLNYQLDLLEDYEQFKKTIEAEQHRGTIELIEPIHTIEFIQVDFSYPNNQRKIINQLNLTITKNISLAIVGLNGAGKTTIIKLLLGLYQPTSGEIRVNNIPLTQISNHSYLQQLSIVFQDFSIFKTTIQDNICFGLKDIYKYNDVLKQLKIDQFTTNDLKPISKVIDPNGIDLSLGQQQKIAIARALYKNGSVMVFDEPTAALDPITEVELFKDIHRLTTDYLTIFISHRLSSCRFAKRVIYLEHGKIIESGSHKELMQLNGHYASLFNKQARYYKKTAN